jgi:outer membrane murein-binding lipoprotein Lpp
MKKTLLLLSVCILAGCANPVRDGINGLRTSVRNGFQKTNIEVNPVVSKVATLEDMKLEASLDDRFDLNGYVTYQKSCKNYLMMTVRFYSANGGALGNSNATSKAYLAGERSKFKASFKQIAHDRNELISRVVVDDLKCI